MTCSISCTCAANSKSNYSYKTKECWWKILQINFETVSSDFSWSRYCLSETIHYFNYSAAIVSIQVTKGKRVCPGFLEEKAKQVCLLILLLNFWHYSKCIYLQNRFTFYEKEKQKYLQCTYFIQGRGKKEGNFPLYLLVTFQALGKGWWHIPSRHAVRKQPSASGSSPHSARPRGKSTMASALGLVSMPDIPPASQPNTG